MSLLDFMRPGPLEKALIQDNNGKIKRTFHIIPAISARLSEQAIANMKKHPKIAFIENDIIFTATSDEYADSRGVSHICSEMVHNNGDNWQRSQKEGMISFLMTVILLMIAAADTVPMWQVLWLPRTTGSV
jgi:hypothetical protein